jgi:hypothetical protein
MLQMSIGGLGAGALAAAIVAAVVLGVVFYGLNSGNRTEQAASLPSTQVRTPQAGDMTVGGGSEGRRRIFPDKNWNSRTLVSFSQETHWRKRCHVIRSPIPPQSQGPRESKLISVKRRVLLAMMRRICER